MHINILTQTPSKQYTLHKATKPSQHTQLQRRPRPRNTTIPKKRKPTQFPMNSTAQLTSQLTTMTNRHRLRRSPNFLARNKQQRSLNVQPMTRSVRRRLLTTKVQRTRFMTAIIRRPSLLTKIPILIHSPTHNTQQRTSRNPYLQHTARSPMAQDRIHIRITLKRILNNLITRRQVISTVSQRTTRHTTFIIMNIRRPILTMINRSLQQSRANQILANTTNTMTRIRTAPIRNHNNSNPRSTFISPTYTATNSTSPIRLTPAVTTLLKRRTLSTFPRQNRHQNRRPKANTNRRLIRHRRHNRFLTQRPGTQRLRTITNVTLMNSNILHNINFSQHPRTITRRNSITVRHQTQTKRLLTRPIIKRQVTNHLRRTIRNRSTFMTVRHQQFSQTQQTPCYTKTINQHSIVNS